MDQQVGLGLLGRAHGQFLMRPVQRVAGLERDHAPPAQLGEQRLQLGRAVAQMAKVIMHRRLDADDAPAEIDLASRIEQVTHAWMGEVSVAEHSLRLVRLIGRHEDSTSISASSTPSASRNAIRLPTGARSANAALTSSVTGIGQRAPFSSRIMSQTL